MTTCASRNASGRSFIAASVASGSAASKPIFTAAAGRLAERLGRDGRIDAIDGAALAGENQLRLAVQQMQAAREQHRYVDMGAFGERKQTGQARKPDDRGQDQRQHDPARARGAGAATAPGLRQFGKGDGGHAAIKHEARGVMPRETRIQ